MPYITVNVEQRPYQITFDDILFGCDPSVFIPKRDTRDTRTHLTKEISDKLKQKTDFRSMYYAIEGFNRKYKHLIETENKATLYRSFRIPKRSGGLRQIDAPEHELMQALKELKDILEHKFFASYHTSAYAYVRGRCTIDSIKKHQANNSRWFLKMDFSKFFPSTTPDFLMRMLCETYPICEYVNQGYRYREELERALSLCFLNGGLPQGTPTSPLLTNMMMIPIDHTISKMCREHSPHLCYTRYADDIHISSEYSFRWTEVQKNVMDIIRSFSAPFSLNPKKTHYGSRNGSNWCLGVMLNKNNDITIGHEKKKIFKAMLFQFMTDFTNGNWWSVDDTMHLQGLISYYTMVEGETITELVAKYSQKFGRDVASAIKEILDQSHTVRHLI